LGGGESGEGGHLGAKAESRNGSEYAADAGGESGAGGLGGGDQSSVTVSADTIALIASKAAQGVDGILALDAGFSGGVAEALGRKDAKAPRADKEPKTQRAPKAPGVKISVGDNEITLSINVVTAFGARIPEVAWNLQERVKNSIEELTGIRAIKVNVLVTGVRMP
jgi:uncharacterized alkaline shock family protein YloU